MSPWSGAVPPVRPSKAHRAGPCPTADQRSERFFLLFVAIKESNHRVEDFFGCSFYIAVGPFLKCSSEKSSNRRLVG